RPRFAARRAILPALPRAARIDRRLAAERLQEVVDLLLRRTVRLLEGDAAAGRRGRHHLPEGVAEEPLRAQAAAALVEGPVRRHEDHVRGRPRLPDRLEDEIVRGAPASGVDDARGAEALGSAPPVRRLAVEDDRHPAAALPAERREPADEVAAILRAREG